MKKNNVFWSTTPIAPSPLKDRLIFFTDGWKLGVSVIHSDLKNLRIGCLESETIEQCTGYVWIGNIRQDLSSCLDFKATILSTRQNVLAKTIESIRQVIVCGQTRITTTPSFKLNNKHKWCFQKVSLIIKIYIYRTEIEMVLVLYADTSHKTCHSCRRLPRHSTSNHWI